MLAKIKKDIVTILIPRIIAKTQHPLIYSMTITYHINPTGKLL
jgi:S-adenosylmethionine synthetase